MRVFIVQRDNIDGLYGFESEDQRDRYAALFPDAEIGTLDVLDGAAAERLIAEEGGDVRPVPQTPTADERRVYGELQRALDRAGIGRAEGGVRGTVVQHDERGYGPFHGAEYHICGKAFTEDGETLECTDDHGHDGPCSQ